MLAVSMRRTAAAAAAEEEEESAAAAVNWSCAHHVHEWSVLNAGLKRAGLLREPFFLTRINQIGL